MLLERIVSMRVIVYTSPRSPNFKMCLYESLCLKKKISFIHFNHTNPLLDESSAELNDVLTKGFMVSRQAELIILK